jgi:hypothetical protein
VTPPLDGGPAYPSEGTDVPSGEQYIINSGMSLRDWFAGQALATTVTRCVGVTDAAKTSYLIADAMLLERSRSAK